MKTLRRTRLITLMLTGIGLFIFGFVWAGLLPAAHAQEDQPDYMGRSECSDCHRHANSSYRFSIHDQTMFEFDDEDYSSALVADLTALPDDVDASTFAYVIGAGRDAQQFVLREGDSLTLLPLTWDVATNRWQAESYHAEYDADTALETCVSCHATGYDAEEAMWVDEGASCESCHGAGEAHIDAADDAGRSIDEDEVVIIREALVEPETACTNCHTDLSNAFAQRFISDQQTDVAERVSLIQAHLGEDEAPEAIAEILETLVDDPAIGIHNVALSETLLNQLERELGLLVPPANLTVQRPVSNPDDCAECHAAEHANWVGSTHANASLLPEFQQVYAENGRPSYCLRCHASGYDPNDQSYAFEGVVCSNCHTIEDGAEHPPAPYTVAKDATVCATCHSGGHASVYEEWLISDHAEAGVDCIDCHTAHTNDLILGDVNTTCGDCHASAMDDEVHMGADLICTDCHMTPRHDVQDPTMLSLTGHAMEIDPGVCSDCHGLTHELSQVVSEDHTAEEIAILSEDIERLEATATNNLTSGLLGGAVGVLLLIGLIYIVLRLGRLK